VELRRSILLTVFVAGVCAVLSGALWQLSSGGASQASQDTSTTGAVVTSGATSSASAVPSVDRAEQSEALAVLRAWDLRRARAWAAGDVPGLRRLYTAGSVTGAADCADLQSYVDRGLVVEGISTQILAASVISSEPNRLVLDVTDRLAASTAVGDGVRLKLPGTQAKELTVELVKQHGGWLVREDR